MSDAGVAAYRAAFARRSAALSAPGASVVDQPGVCGLIGSSARSGGRLLITDDRAVPLLDALLPDLRVQIINVFAEATRCREQIERAALWHGEASTAMSCRDLALLPTLPTPEGLTIRPVNRAPGDPVDGVPLEVAARACSRADTSIPEDSLPEFVAYLKSLPTNTRLMAAVDDQNIVRGTAGSSALGDDAVAYFVSTDHEWRHRGVATAMTAAVLAWARDAGARAACLDASRAGFSIYLRLGFEAVSTATLFSRLD